MNEIVMYIIFACLFVGIIAYSCIAPGLMKKKGRIVDARVISCEEHKVSADSIGYKTYGNMVKVDFDGLNGETIEKLVPCERPYMEGEIVRSIYVDEKDKLFFDVNEQVNENNPSKVIAIVVALTILVVGLFAIITKEIEDENIRRMMSFCLAYVVGVLFAGYGLYRYLSVKSKDKTNIKVIEGTLISYEKRRGGGNTRRTVYRPIYEYFLGEQKLVYKARIAGNSQKFRQIGRKVNIEYDMVTKKVSCREDEKAASMLYVCMALVGVLTLVVTVLNQVGII